MSNRSAKFVSALVATILAGANFTAVAENTAKTTDTKTSADSCLSGPKWSAPAGSHWHYRVERDTKRKCWYLGDEKKTAKATPAKQDAAAPDTVATSADAAPVQAAPPQPAQTQAAPAMRQSVANARAELTTAQSNVAPTANVAVAQADPAAAPVNPPSSPVSTRWLDAQSMGSTNGARFAATQPTTAAPAEAAPAPEPAAASAAV